MESFKNGQQEQNERKENLQKWNVARRQVEHIVDKLGLGIDEGMKDTVAIFKAMDFQTDSSCAGHTEKDGYSPPYLQFYTPAPEGWKEDESKKLSWKETNIKQQEKLIPLMTVFYNSRDSVLDAQLRMVPIGTLGGFRLQSLGTKMDSAELGIKNVQDIFNKITLYQNEMTAFTEFLKDSFLNGKKI